MCPCRLFPGWIWNLAPPVSGLWWQEIRRRGSDHFSGPVKEPPCLPIRLPRTFGSVSQEVSALGSLVLRLSWGIKWTVKGGRRYRRLEPNNSDQRTLVRTDVGSCTEVRRYELYTSRGMSGPSSITPIFCSTSGPSVKGRGLGEYESRFSGLWSTL